MGQHAIQSILLASRPQGSPVPENFRAVHTPCPELSNGQVLLRTLWLSLDPYMRGRMDAGASYAPGLELNQPMPAELVSTVVETRHPGWHVDDIVAHDAGWQDYTVTDGTGMRRLDPDMAPCLHGFGSVGNARHDRVRGHGQHRTTETGRDSGRRCGSRSGRVGRRANRKNQGMPRRGNRRW